VRPNRGLHDQFGRELSVVRRESRRATCLMLLSITIFLVACENDKPRASKTGSTDANRAFAEYAARANATPTASAANGPSRGHNGFSGSGGASGGVNQSGF
jgi:hypothetical protein